MALINYKNVKKVLALFDIEDLKYLDLDKIFPNKESEPNADKEKQYVKKRGENNDKPGT